MATTKKAEDSLLNEMLEEKAERDETGDMTVKLVTPCNSVQEIGERVKRASALSPSYTYRVGLRFLVDIKLFRQYKQFE